MKKLIQIIICFGVLLSACSKQDINQAPTVSEIRLLKDKIGVGQLIVGAVDITDPENDTLNIKYLWSDDYGFTWDKDDLNWRPSKAGQQNIKVTIIDGENQVSKTKSVMVYECDYRFALWGDPMFEILINEYPDQPVVVSSGLVYTDKTNSTIGHAYYINSSLEVYAGAELYTKRYNYGDYNGYISDYERYRSDLIAKLGNPVDQDTIWSSNMIGPELYKTRKENWGDALMLKYLKLYSYWMVNGNNITLQLFNNGTVMLATTYQKQ